MRIYSPRISALHRFQARMIALPRHQDIIAKYLRMCEFQGWTPSLSGLVALMRAECRKGCA